MTHRLNAITHTQEYTVLPGVVRHTFIIFGLFTTTNLCPPPTQNPGDATGSGTERPRGTKIGTVVAHVTRDSYTTFSLSRSKCQRSRSPGRFTHRGVNASGSCSGDSGNVLAVGTYCYVACNACTLQARSTRRRGAHRGRRGAGAYCSGRPTIACFLVNVASARCRGVTGDG